VFATLSIAAPLSAQDRPTLPRDRDTNDWLAYYERGIEVGRRSARESQSYFRTAARLDPTSSGPLINLYLAGFRGPPVRIRSGDGMGHTVHDTVWPQAEDVLNQALLLNPDLILFVMTEHLRAAHLTNATARLQRGVHLFDTQDWAGSIRELSGAVRRTPGDTRPLFWRGIAYARLEQWPEALRDYEEVVAEFPCGKAPQDAHRPGIFLPGLSASKLYYAVAYMALRGRDTTRAKVMLNRAVDCDLTFDLPHVLLGNLALARADTMQAFASYQVAVDRRADDPFLRFALGAILLSLGRSEQALPHLTEAVRLSPDFALPRYHQARAYDQLGRVDEARRAYQGFLARVPRRLGTMIRSAEERLRELTARPVAP
jgi:tetratricopeptide (TPR) repeat protein